MKYPITVFLPDEAIAHIDAVAKKMGDKQQSNVARSNVVEWLVMKHRKRVAKPLSAKVS